MTQQTMYRQPPPQKKKRSITTLVLILSVLILGAAAGIHALTKQPSTQSQNANSQNLVSLQSNPTPVKTVQPAAKPNPCSTNTLSKLALVSISQRHMWACDNATVVYDSPVVTGMEKLVADLTPIGTYHIYAKQTDLYLNGSDSTGSWHDYVYYWLPFLTNQYGTYGFHDATWRAANAFGNISPESSDASHGCVEMPLATARWLYGWASIGTTVTIES